MSVKRHFIYFLLVSVIVAACNTTKKLVNSKSETHLVLVADNSVIAHSGAWKKNNLPENYSNRYFKTKQDYAYFDKCGKWFVCGNKKCGNIMNADILASENIQRKF